MMYGLDYLGGAMYADVILREHPEGWAAGFFANTFGDAWETIARLLATGRCPCVRIHAVWQDDHRYNAKRDDPVIMRELERANKLKSTFPQVQVQFSPFCEHTITGTALTALFAKVKKAAGDLVLVNSSLKGATIPASVGINEVHGKAGAPRGAYNYSFDGQSCVDADVEATKERHKRAGIFFLWAPQFNGRKNLNDKTPRPERKAYPTSQLIDSVIYLHRTRGTVSLPSNHLWKSHADQHNAPKPEARALKPVYILPIKADRVELVADNGQVVAVSGGAQPYEDGRWRYYFPDFGYVMAEKARRIHAKPTCTVRVGGKVVGTVNPAYRAGVFR
ncbi:MAG: hypothetical protein EB060_09540 [Proteobacteria bacterium]|nr:hypothetical protein [Pseudomonadota bacterium]